MGRKLEITEVRNRSKEARHASPTQGNAVPNHDPAVEVALTYTEGESGSCTTETCMYQSARGGGHGPNSPQYFCCTIFIFRWTKRCSNGYRYTANNHV